MLTVLGTLCLGGYAALCAAVYKYQDNLIYFPSAYMETDPASAGLAFEDFEVEVEPGVVVYGWIVEKDAGAPWILHFNGNAGNISHRIDFLRLFDELGFNGVLFDYRGYGKSTGTPTEAGIIADGLAVVKYLQQEREVDPKTLIYWGESLGGGVAAAVSVKRAPRALILKSTFTSVPDMGADAYPFLPVKLLSTTKFQTKELIGSFLFPKLVAHGQADTVVPFHHGQRLYQMASEPKVFVQLSGDHNTSPLGLGEEFRQTVKNFVLEAVPKD